MHLSVLFLGKMGGQNKSGRTPAYGGESIPSVLLSLFEEELSGICRSLFKVFLG